MKTFLNFKAAGQAFSAYLLVKVDEFYPNRRDEMCKTFRMRNDTFSLIKKSECLS